MINSKKESKEKSRIRMRRYIKNHSKERREYQAKNMRKYYNQNKEKFRKKSKKYYADHRNEILKKQKERDKNVVNEKARQYRERRKLLCLANQANFRYNNREKISAWDLWKIVKRQKLICALTGDMLDNKNISLDHIKPMAKGGRNVPSNLRLVTRDANALKNSHTDSHLLNLCQKVVRVLSHI